MPSVESIVAVMIAGFFLSATPGPSMLYVLSRSVGQSRSAGMASALGLAMGGVILALATALGLATLFEEVPVLVVVLRYVGSLYLFYLGASMIMNAQSEARAELHVHDVAPKSFSSIIWQGILVELLNPKTVLFFALFLPPFVEIKTGSAEASDSYLQFLILGALVPLTAIPADTIVAYMGGTLSQTINQRQRVRKWLGWAGGMILIFIALNLHLNLI